MKSISLQGRIGEDHRLTADVPTFLPVGLLEVRLVLPDAAVPDDLDAQEEADWRLFVAQGLREELADSREDIYTVEDGEPIDEAEYEV